MITNKSFSHHKKLCQHDGCPVKNGIDHACLFWETEICAFFIRAAPHGLVPWLPFDVLCYIISYTFKIKFRIESSLLP